VLPEQRPIRGDGGSGSRVGLVGGRFGNGVAGPRHVEVEADPAGQVGDARVELTAVPLQRLPAADARAQDASSRKHLRCERRCGACQAKP